MHSSLAAGNLPVEGNQTLNSVKTTSGRADMILVTQPSDARDRAKKNMIRFVAGSIALHALLGLTIAWRVVPSPQLAPAVEVEFLAAPRPKAPVSKSRSAPVPDQQIVEQEHQLNDEVDPRTRFLSAFNQRVEQQTRAERSGKFNNHVNGGKLTRDKSAVGEKHAAARSASERGSLGDLLPRYDAPSLGQAERAAANQPEGDPTRTDDYLKELKSGLQTMMSTKEFVYYAYYNRIKAALRSHWEPEVRERVGIILRQGRQVAAARDRVTQVVVTLDARGELLGVRVLSRSGLSDLDQAAIDAFHRAAPFPNPPRGMVQVDGTVEIRWDFVLEV